MTTHTDRAPRKATADDRVVLPHRSDQDADGKAIGNGTRPVHGDRGVLEQFMRNLMVALGAWPI